MSWGCPHQMDPLPTLPSTRGDLPRDHPHMLRAMAQRRSELRHFLYVPGLLVHSRPYTRIACLIFPTCNSSSNELFGNPLLPATSPSRPSRHIGNFPGLRSKGTLLCPCGLAARSRYPPPFIYSSVDYFPTHTSCSIHHPVPHVGLT